MEQNQFLTNKNNIPGIKSLFIYLFIFAVSMGFLEAIVVVYVRELFYPEGFAFPLKPLPEWLIATEMIRELCTLLMLFSVAWITGKLFFRRLAAFLFLFGVWDIFYYVALWLFLKWPDSLLTWDILFLIPVAWTGPVLAPVICSLIMIFLAFLLEWLSLKNNQMVLSWKEIVLVLSGSFIIFLAFIFDFAEIIIKGNYLSDFFNLPENVDFINEMSSYTPERFQTELFTSGIIFITAGIFLFVRKNLQQKMNN